MTARKRLGDLLVETGLIKEEELNQALKLQVGGNRRLGYLLIKMGFINEEQLQTVLSKQLDLPLVDINQGFRDTVKHILPRYLCKKYNIIPLDLGDHNLLIVAMADPSDSGAVADIEQYTGKVLQPCLASHSKIEAAIRKFIPWSFKDLFNPLNSLKFIALATVITLGLVIITILQYNGDQLRTQHGTKQITGNAVSYQNHELILRFDKSGKTSLQGHGAYAQGSYSVLFNNLDSLQKFIDTKSDELSKTQREWLAWVLEKQSDNK